MKAYIHEPALLRETPIFIHYILLLMSSKLSYTLLTFYHFVDIQDPHSEVRQHGQFTRDIGLQGRIYIGEEGISATVT